MIVWFAFTLKITLKSRNTNSRKFPLMQLLLSSVEMYLERLAHLLLAFLEQTGGLYSANPERYYQIRRYKTSLLKKTPKPQHTMTLYFLFKRALCILSFYKHEAASSNAVPL